MLSGIKVFSRPSNICSLDMGTKAIAASKVALLGSVQMSKIRKMPPLVSSQGKRKA